MKAFTLNHINSGGKKRFFQSLHNESGIALVVALLLMIVMISLVPVATQMTSGDKTRSTNFENSRESFFIADAGLEHAKLIASNITDMNELLRGEDLDASTTPNGLTYWMSGGSETTYTYNGTTNTYYQMALKDPADSSKTVGQYYVRAYDNNDEGTGTDDPMVDTDGVVYLESIGVSADGTTKGIRAMVQRYIIIPKLPAAVTLVGPLSQITSTGSGFNVMGGKASGGSISNAVHTDGSIDPNCAAANGIATESGGPTQYVADTSYCTDATCAAFTGGASSKIVGASNGTPDLINGQTVYTASDAQELHSLLTSTGIPNASYSNTVDASASVSGTPEWGSTTDPNNPPTVVYFTGDLTVMGNVEGAGVLIVDGDLDITGSLDWDGVVLVGSCATCDGALVGTGSATIDGAMVVGNSIDAAVNFTGNATIRYSCDGVDLANRALGSPLTVASWKEL